MPNEPAQCGGKTVPPLDQGDTPYGYWHCSNGAWIWIPELGRMAKAWNAIVSFFLIKPRNKK